MNNFMQDVNGELNKTLTSTTENGNVSYATSGASLVDFFFAAGSFRRYKTTEIIKYYSKLFNDNRSLALKMLFYTGDVRQGLGERRTFKVLLKWLASRETDDYSDEKVKKILELVPFYTRWDNLFVLQKTKWENLMLEVINEQLQSDLKNLKLNKPISILGKWLPSANTSSKETRKLACWMLNKLGYTPRKWRKCLSTLRKNLNLVEIDASAKNWSEIDYSKVPSKANIKYRKAFLNHDKFRREKYLSNMNTTVHSKVNFPYEITHGILHAKSSSEVLTFERLWTGLAQYEGLNNTLVVRDGSGSMTSKISGSVSCLDVADSLTLYCSERNNGGFRNAFITFSSHPQLIKLNDSDSLCDKLKYLRRFDDMSNTNIEKVFNLVLNTAIHNKYRQSDLPKQILIISDMEFDYIDSKKYGLDHFKELYEEHDYKLPKLIFWNVGSSTMSFPMQENDNGLLLVGGFSPVILNLINSEEKDPYKAIIRILHNSRYDLLNL